MEIPFNGCADGDPVTITVQCYSCRLRGLLRRLHAVGSTVDAAVCTRVRARRERTAAFCAAAVSVSIPRSSRVRVRVSTCLIALGGHGMWWWLRRVVGPHEVETRESNFGLTRFGSNGSHFCAQTCGERKKSVQAGLA